jgi:predicted phage terminase large subunit-like protein
VIDRCRMDPGDPLPDMRRVIVGVDPSGTSGDEDDRSDAVGIVVAGKGVDGRYYVLEDLTCQESPAGWGKVVANAYHRHKADKVVAERNYGGAMVEHVIQSAGVRVAYKEVVASRGKVVRAEPISFDYEKGMVSHAPQFDKHGEHIGSFPELEDQMSQMTTAGYTGDRSPDRVDALVWALTELREGLGGGINVSRETAQTFGAAMANIGRRRPGGGGLRFGGL